MPRSLDRRPNRRRVGTVLARTVVSAALLALLPGAARADERHDHGVVVKYRDSVDACVHCMLAHGTPLARFTGTSSLDALHARLGVRGAQATFVEHHTLDGGRLAAWAARTSAAAALAPQRASRGARGAAPVDLSGIYELELPPGADVAAAAAALAADPDVLWAEPVGERRASYAPDDVYFGTSGAWGQSYADLWGLQATGVSTVWDTATGAGTVVAVVDTGVHVKHKDLAANVWQNPGEIARNRIDDDGNGFVDDVQGWDFVRRNARMADRHGHGTHVAGTVAAVGDNGLGVVGMAFGAKIMPLRALDERGEGRTTELAQAIVYAVENGADVINNSWGGYGPPASVIADAIALATEQGVVVVFAAGNEGQTGYALGEANLPDAIAVAATSPTGAYAGFSNWGDAISVAAPGVEVLSTRGTSGRVGGKKVTGRYLRLSGTSMAAPHVAGLAAVLLSARPELTVEQVRWHLELSARQPGFPGFEGASWNPYLGWGHLDAASVLDTPPVTTRVKLSPTERHAFAGTVNPELARLSVRFTTLDQDVPWSFAGAAGFTSSLPSGDGDATLAIGFDGTGLGAGTIDGTAGVTAAAAIDGGASRALRVHLHEETRVGEPVLLQNDVANGSDAPAVASNGTATIAVWGEHLYGLKAALLGSDGSVTSPITLAPQNCGGDACWRWPSNAIAVGSDGAGFLVAYRSYVEEWSYPQPKETRREYLHALRVNADGTLVDGAPIEIASLVQTAPHENPSYDGWFGFPRVTFDGEKYVVLWSHNRENGGRTDTTTTYLRRVPVAGAVTEPAVEVYPVPATGLHQIVFPDVACVAPADCLVAWIESTGDTVPGGTLWERNMVGVRVHDGVVASGPPQLLLANAAYNAFVATRVVAHPGGYGVLGLRNSCPGSGSTLCGYDLVAGLASATGTPVDPAGFVVNTRDAGEQPYCRPIGMTFDGSAFVVAYFDLRSNGDGDVTQPRVLFPGSPIFAARFTPGGVVLDHEKTGRLVHGGDTALAGEVVRSGPGAVVVWEDNRHASPQNTFSIWAQRLSLQ